MAKTTGMQLVTNFNIITGLKLRTGENDKKNTPNADKMEDLLRRGIPFDRICNYMEDWYDDNKNSINSDTAMVMFYTTTIAKHSRNEMPRCTAWNKGVRVTEMPKTEIPKPEPPKEEPKAEETIPANPSTEQGIAGILSGVVNLVSDTVEARMVNKIEEFVEQRIKNMPRREVTVNYNGVKRDVRGITHKKFEDVLFAVTHGLNVMLVGPAGSGKNVLCEQVAEAMGLRYRFTNAITYEHQLMGFTDANGVYQPTPFYDVCANGGLFDLDEADGSSSEVFLKLNAALSGDTVDFPAPIGNIKKHKDCHFIATANTYGLGADYDYVGRNVLDAASLNRFIQIYIDYDPAIEELKANGDKELLNFCREFRKSCGELGIRTILSYRNIEQMATMSMMPNIKLSTVIDYCLTGALKYDDLRMLDDKRTDCGVWSTAFHSLVKERKAA